MTYGNHGGVAFWTAPLATGTGAGQYSTLGIISYQVTFNTIAVPAVTKQVTATKYVVTKSHGKVVRVSGKAVYHKVTYKTTVIVTPAVAGASGHVRVELQLRLRRHAQRGAGGLSCRT